MEIKNLIKNKLLQYLSNEISKNDLYKWALDILHKMLKGDIFKINYLEVWGIINGLTEVNDNSDLYCRKTVEKFIKILSGNQCDSFTFAIKIPQKYVVNNLLKSKKNLQKYAIERHLLKTEILELESIIQKTNNTPKTLSDLLEQQIIDLLKLGYDFFHDEERVDFNLKSTVFISEDMSSSLEEEFLRKIIALLDCYDGMRCFYIHTNFSNGIGDISILE